METSNLKRLIDQRLDLMDQALLGLLPREERQELISQVELRVKAAQTAGTVTEVDLPQVGRLPEATTQVARSRSSRPGGSRLSSLALLAGLSGIGALLLMVGMPITFLVGSVIAESVGETGVIVAFGTQVFLIAFGGLAAVVLGFASLVRLSRQSEVLRGRGWAITALTTGAMPTLVGGMLALTTTISVLASSTGNAPAVVNAPVMQASPVGGPMLPPPICPDSPAGCRTVEWPAAPMLAPANQIPQPLPSIMPVGSPPYSPAPLSPAPPKPEPASKPVPPAGPAVQVAAPPVTPAITSEETSDAETPRIAPSNSPPVEKTPAVSEEATTLP